MMTRNESADAIQKTWSDVVEQSPHSTALIRGSGVMAYISNVLPVRDIEALHTDHYNWLVNALDDAQVLNQVDVLAATARAAGGELAVPWRD